MIVRFLVKRLMLTVPLLLLVIFATFMLVRLGGQDPVGLLAGPAASAEEIAGIRAHLGLEQPVLVQFWFYVLHILHGDLGQSWLTGQSILSDILERVPATLELVLMGVGLGALIGIPSGIAAAAAPDRVFDQTTRFLALLGFSIPTYFLGLLMLLVFFYELDWAPPGMGRISLMVTQPPTITGSFLIDALLTWNLDAAASAASQLILPVASVAIIATAPILKQTRAIALDVLASDYVAHARALGLTPRTIRRMTLRNSLVPVITFTASELVGFAGVVSLIEYVFAWGGLGQYGLTAITRGDFAAVQGYVLALALFSVFVFLVVDVVVLAIEPRSTVAA